MVTAVVLAFCSKALSASGRELSSKELNIDKLLSRSAEYVAYILRQPLYDNTDRIRISHVMCSVSLEHAESIKILIASGNFTSALGLLRLQFESFVRGIWVMYAASERALEKLTAELNDESQRRANNLPMLSEMISQLEKKVPKDVIVPILEFKEYSWKPLSSYVHGGLHAIERHSKGYPIPLLEQVLKNSNGVNGLVAVFGAILTGQVQLTQDVYESLKEYSDCFQIRVPFAL